MSLITLLTDFGLRDSYVGIMKGVILGRAPHCQMVDLTHQVAPQSVLEALFVLEGSFRYFPKGTIHVAVVDPGVGSQRSILAVETDEGLFLAPDNGLLTLQYERAHRIHEVKREELFLDNVSMTFHGRDIFAPVAAALATGMGVEELGPKVEPQVRLSLAKPEVSAQRIQGEIIYQDHFGNLVTNIPQSILGEVIGTDHSHQVLLGDRSVGPLRDTYAAVEPDECLALIGSFGYLEIAVRNGHAAHRLNGRLGHLVTVELESRTQP